MTEKIGQLREFSAAAGGLVLLCGLLGFLSLNEFNDRLSDERRASDAVRPADLVQLIEQGAGEDVRRPRKEQRN